MITTLGNCQYNIDEISPHTVHIWGAHNSDLNGPEWILQPHNPENNNQPWVSVAEAETWVIGFIKDMENIKPINSTISDSEEI